MFTCPSPVVGPALLSGYPAEFMPNTITFVEPYKTNADLSFPAPSCPSGQTLYFGTTGPNASSTQSARYFTCATDSTTAKQNINNYDPSKITLSFVDQICAPGPAYATANAYKDPSSSMLFNAMYITSQNL